MSLTTKIFLDRRYTKSDGKQVIKIRAIIDRKLIEFTSGIAISPACWNPNKMEIKPSCKDFKNVTRLNHTLKRQRLDIEDRLLELISNQSINTMSLKDIKAFVLREQVKFGLLEYNQKHIDQLKEAKKFGNARVYTTLYRSLKTFLKQKDIAIATLSYSWLTKYQSWYLGKGNSVNGLSVHLRTLRALINKAIAEGLISREQYPFENFTIKSEKTKKRAISEEDILKVKEYQPTTKQKERAKDYFLMSFYLMGASFVDLAYMKMHQIQDGRIEYRRKKTHQLYNIKITQPLQTILDKYTLGKERDDFVLNVIKSKNESKQYQQVREELDRYNKRIKEVGKSCGITKTMSSYVARHTFASVAKFKGISTSIISQALGHENSKTTEIYLAQFDNETMDNFNEQILG